MNQEEQNKIYDFVFIGLGASNSLILIPDSALEKNRYFHCQISNA